MSDSAALSVDCNSHDNGIAPKPAPVRSNSSRRETSPLIGIGRHSKVVTMRLTSFAYLQHPGVRIFRSQNVPDVFIQPMFQIRKSYSSGRCFLFIHGFAAAYLPLGNDRQCHRRNNCCHARHHISNKYASIHLTPKNPDQHFSHPNLPNSR